MLDVSPSQVYGDDVLVYRLVGLDAEILQPKPNFEKKVDGFARPAPGVSLQGLFGRASQVRTSDVRRGFLPGVPFGKEYADIKGNVLQTTGGVSYILNLCRNWETLGHQ